MIKLMVVQELFYPDRDYCYMTLNSELAYHHRDYILKIIHKNSAFVLTIIYKKYYNLPI